MSRLADRPTDPAERARALLGVAQYETTGEFPVERGYVWTTCSSVENGNPLFWDNAVAAALTAGPIAPPTMLSVWFRPHHWAPGGERAQLPLQVHFDLKELFGLPEAVMTDNTIVFHEPVRVGDMLRTRQFLRSVSDEKSTKLGRGRFWVIDVEYENQRGELVGVETYTGFGYRRRADVGRSGTSAGGAEGAGSRAAAGAVTTPGVSAVSGAGASADAPAADASADAPAADGPAADGPAADARWHDEHSLVPERLFADVALGDRLPTLSHDVSATTVVLGALASRDWRPMHHDKDFAVVRNGTRDIFLNTPTQAAWFERYVTDWTGPHGRLGRMSFRMHGSVFPGDRMVFDALVGDIGVDDVGCGWIGLDVTLSVGGDPKSTCRARVALPVEEHDNPWARRSQAWRP